MFQESDKIFIIESKQLCTRHRRDLDTVTPKPRTLIFRFLDMAHIHIN